jgi:hypothetical protein
MEKVGIHGDLWSEVRNRHSRRVYLILTQPERSSDHWVTYIFSLIHKKALLGLLTFTLMDFNRPLATFKRKTKEEFQELIQNVEHHVEEEEAEMFPLAEEELAEDLTDMKDEMQELKADLQGS